MVEEVRGLRRGLEAEREKVAGVGARAAREGARSREGRGVLGRGCAAPCEDRPASPAVSSALAVEGLLCLGPCWPLCCLPGLGESVLGWCG